MDIDGVQLSGGPSQRYPRQCIHYFAWACFHEKGLFEVGIGFVHIWQQHVDDPERCLALFRWNKKEFFMNSQPSRQQTTKAVQCGQKSSLIKTTLTCKLMAIML